MGDGKKISGKTKPHSQRRLDELIDGGLLARLTGTQTKVLIMLFQQADEANVTWTGPERIAERAGLSLRMTYNIIKELKAMGVVETIGAVVYLRNGGRKVVMGDTPGGRNKAALRRLNLVDPKLCNAVSVKRRCRVFSENSATRRRKTLQSGVDKLCNAVAEDHSIDQANDHSRPAAQVADVPSAPRAKGKTRKSRKGRSAAADVPAKVNGKHHPAGKQVSDHKQLVDYFCERWKRCHADAGDAYPFDGKDAKLLETVLGKVKGNLTRAKHIVRVYLADDEPFVAEPRHPIGLLKTRLAKYISATSEAGAQAELEKDPDALSIQPFDPELMKELFSPEAVAKTKANDDRVRSNIAELKAIGVAPPLYAVHRFAERSTLTPAAVRLLTVHVNGACDERPERVPEIVASRIENGEFATGLLHPVDVVELTSRGWVKSIDGTELASTDLRAHADGLIDQRGNVVFASHRLHADRIVLNDREQIRTHHAGLAEQRKAAS